MRVVTQEDLDAHQAAVVKGGAKGLGLGLAVSLPGSWLLHRRWPYYRSLPLSLKALGVITIAVPWCVIEAERQGSFYEQAQWKGAKGYDHLTRAEEFEQARWASLKPKEKAIDWASRNKYKIIAGSWVTSMGISWAIISRNQHQTFAQKIVQARIWAQGLTLAVLLASAGLSQVSRHNPTSEHRVVDHSWKEQVENIPPTSKSS